MKPSRVSSIKLLESLGVGIEKTAQHMNIKETATKNGGSTISVIELMGRRKKIKKIHLSINGGSITYDIPKKSIGKESNCLPLFD